MTQHLARILLADDDITNQQATLAVLENLGLLADGVGNGQEALEALQSKAYDLVLMDCQMPVLDGYETTTRIRNGTSKVHDPQVPVIALTAGTSLTQRAQCLACGMDDFLLKPVLPQALNELLVKWLPKDRRWGKRPTPPSAQVQPDQEPAGGAVIWDQQGMLARLMGDEGVAQTIIAGFLADLPFQMQVLETSLAQGDLLAIMRQAHRIRGAAAIVGGNRLQATAVAMEQAAPKGHTPTLHALFDVLRLECAILQQKITQTPLLPGDRFHYNRTTTGSSSLSVQGADNENAHR